MPAELVSELLAVGAIALLLVSSVSVGWRNGLYDEPQARRAGMTGAVVAVAVMALTEWYALPPLVSTAALVGAVLAVAALFRYSDRTRRALSP